MRVIPQYLPRNCVLEITGCTSPQGTWLPLDWIEADGNYVRFHAGSEAHYIRATLARLENQLPPGKFLRISRSALVNLDRVKELQPLFYGDYVVILQNGSRLNMSRNFRDRIESMLASKR